MVTGGGVAHCYIVVSALEEGDYVFGECFYRRRERASEGGREDSNDGKEHKRKCVCQGGREDSNGEEKVEKLKMCLHVFAWRRGVDYMIGVIKVLIRQVELMAK